MNATQELLEHLEDEGVNLIVECLREANRALGINYTIADLLMASNVLLSQCVRGAWMKRVRCN